MMRRLISVTAMSLALAACASDEPAPASLTAPAAAPAAPPPPADAHAPLPQPTLPPPPPPRDACGAEEAQGLVGRSRSEIPVPLRPGLQRVACTTCPVTMDYNPRRLNFFYDSATGLIKEVKCG